MTDESIARLRRFNRLYLRVIGLLEERDGRSAYSPAEVRVLYEIANRDRPTASELASDLHLDPGYLSRMLRGFRARGLVTAGPSPTDGRRSHLRLTPAGMAVSADLDRGARAAAARLLETIPGPEQRTLLDALSTAERILGPAGVLGQA